MSKRKNKDKDTELTLLGNDILESLKDKSTSLTNESFQQIIELLFNTTKECEKRRPLNNCRDNPNCFHHLGGIKLLGYEIDDNDDLFGQENDQQVEHYVTESILKLHQKDIIRNTKRDSLDKPCGLRNLGATCYMNSVIQTLFMNSQFKHHLLNFDQNNKDNNHNEKKQDEELTEDEKDEKEINVNNDKQQQQFKNQIVKKECINVNDSMDDEDVKMAIQNSLLDQNNNNNNYSVEDDDEDIKMFDTIITSTTSTTSTTTTTSTNNNNILNDIDSPIRSPTMSDEKQPDFIHIKDEGEDDGKISVVENGSLSTDLLYQLAFLFYNLQLSNRQTIDPTPLVNCLQLPSHLQQDTQEFYNLFIGLLESKFKDDAISKIFKGSYNYVTECLHCHNRSYIKSSFFEITLKTEGCKTLKDSINDYLSTEKLQDVSCSKCDTKRDCKRSIEFSQLPYHLNFQLLRYVFDKETFHKKKLHDLYSFPLEVDLAHLIVQQNGASSSSNDKIQSDEYIYELTAIMMHKGMAISSGHYITHVKNELTDEWWEFDDEDVKKLTPERIGKDSLGEKRKPKELKEGMISSNSSYTIIYSKKNREKKQPPTQIINNQLIEKEFERKENDYLIRANKFKQTIKDAKKLYIERKDNILAINSKLILSDDEKKYNWINSEWLSNWVKGIENGPIDNSNLLCEHGLLAMTGKLESMKRTSQGVWDFLYASHQGGPVLTQDSYCQICLYRLLSGKKENVDTETFKEQLIKKDREVKDRKDGFIISKHWLKEWSKKNVKKSIKDTSPTSDIECDHKNLTINKDDRIIISFELWQYILTQYPDNPEFTAQPSKECEICLKLDKESNDQFNHIKKQRVQLRPLITLIKSKKYNFNFKVGIYYLVDKEWMNRWYRFIYSDKSEEEEDGVPPGPLSSAPLMCAHDGLSYDFVVTEIPSTFDLDDKNVPFLIVPLVIWKVLSEAYECKDVPVSFEDGLLSINSCQECHQAKNQLLERERVQFHQESLFIHIISDKADEKDQKYYLFPTKTRRLYKRVEVWPVDYDYTVSQLKLLICTITSTPTFQQQLYVNEGELMKDHQTLGHYQITPKQVIVFKESEDMDGFFEDFGGSEMGFKGTTLI